MAKLHDLFTQARRTQSGGSMGFLSKAKAESKAHAAALIVAFPHIREGHAQEILKAGADGLLFTWDGENSALLETLKQEIDIVKADTENNQVVCGLHLTGDLNTLDHDSFTHFRELGIQYVILPFDAPARLLAVEEKEIEKVVTVPMREGDMYPLFIRSLAGFESIAAVLLDFDLTKQVGSMSIEDVLHYRAVREAVRFPALLNVNNDIDEAETYTLKTLGIQAVILTASANKETTSAQVKRLRAILEKIHKEEREKENDTPSLLKG